MKKKIVTPIIILLLAVAPGSNIFSQQGRGLGPCGLGLGPGNFSYYRLLNLTEEQQIQMRDLWLEQLDVINPLNAELRKLTLAYWDLIAESDEDLDAISKNIDQQTDLENKIMKENARFRKKMQGVLTEEQKELLDSEFPYGRGMYGRGNLPGRGFGQGYGYGPGRGYGRSFGRGFGPGYGRGYGRGLGRGYGRGFGPGGIW